MITAELLKDAEHELNRRKRGRAARFERLKAAGLPAGDHGALSVWLAKAEREFAVANGALVRGHSCLVKNASDPSLPTIGKYAAMIEVATPHATYEADEDHNGDSAGWYSSAYGGGTIGIGGPHETHEAALAAAEEALKREGFHRDLARGETEAITRAKQRESAREMRAIRARMGLTQVEFAEKLGVTGNYVAMVERGERVPSETLLRLARTLAPSADKK